MSAFHLLALGLCPQSSGYSTQQLLSTSQCSRGCTQLLWPGSASSSVFPNFYTVGLLFFFPPFLLHQSHKDPTPPTSEWLSCLPRINVSQALTHSAALYPSIKIPASPEESASLPLLGGKRNAQVPPYSCSEHHHAVLTSTRQDNAQSWHLQPSARASSSGRLNLKE